MKVIGINGSPRKKWNTAILLGKALEGAASEGVETEDIHLYGLKFTGCISCFACKTIGGASYGKCAVRDDLTPLLERIDGAGGLILASPIYYGCVTGVMRCFIGAPLLPLRDLHGPAGDPLPEEDSYRFHLHHGRDGGDGKGARLRPRYQPQ